MPLPPELWFGICLLVTITTLVYLLTKQIVLLSLNISRVYLLPCKSLFSWGLIHLGLILTLRVFLVYYLYSIILMPISVLKLYLLFSEFDLFHTLYFLRVAEGKLPFSCLIFGYLLEAPSLSFFLCFFYAFSPATLPSVYLSKRFFTHPFEPLLVNLFYRCLLLACVLSPGFELLKSQTNAEIDAP